MAKSKTPKTLPAYKQLSVRSMVSLYNTFAVDPRVRFASRAHGITCIERLVREKKVLASALNKRAAELLKSGEATPTSRTRNRFGLCGVHLKAS